MAQKVNPIGVRLGLNRHTESNWFSNYYYSTLNAQDYVVRHYLNNIKRSKGTELGIRAARSIIHHYPKRTQIHLFYLGKNPNLFKKASYEKQLKSPKWCNEINLAVTRTRQLVKLSTSRNSVKRRSPISKWSHSKAKLHKMAELFRGSQLVNFELSDLTLSTVSYSKEFWRQKSISRNVETMLQQTDYKEAAGLVTNQVNTFIPDSFSLWSRFQLNASSDSIHTLLMKHSQLFMDRPFLWNHLQKALSAKTPTLMESESLLSNHTRRSTEKSTQSYSSTHGEGDDSLCLGRPSSVPSSTEHLRADQILSLPYFSKGAKILRFGGFRRLNLVPIKVQSLFQSANLLAQEICINLEKKKSFRQIWRSILFEMNKLNYIKGIRIACSGRLNGAEIAKIECRKYAATSLHVFSDEIDYGFQEAKTLYGILGVKVWIAYKQK